MADAVIVAFDPPIFPPWSARNLSHDLQPDDGIEVYRDGNRQLQVADPPGGLEAARKLRLTISGHDVIGFALNNIWVGQEFTVKLAQTSWAMLGPSTTTVTLARDPVAGSVFCKDEDDGDVAVTQVIGRQVTVAAHAGKVAYVGYRMQLVMLLSEPWQSRFERNSHTYTKSLTFREK